MPLVFGEAVAPGIGNQLAQAFQMKELERQGIQYNNDNIVTGDPKHKNRTFADINMVVDKSMMGDNINKDTSPPMEDTMNSILSGQPVQNVAAAPLVQQPIVQQPLVQQQIVQQPTHYTPPREDDVIRQEEYLLEHNVEPQDELIEEPLESKEIQAINEAKELLEQGEALMFPLAAPSQAHA